MCFYKDYFYILNCNIGMYNCLENLILVFKLVFCKYDEFYVNFLIGIS